MGYTGHDDIKPDILIHWDDDDWSHPNRIAEQVALLQASQCDVVGYNRVLFWRSVEQQAWVYDNHDPRYCVGSSLAYWRRTWERKPFTATSQGEDVAFITGLKSRGVDSIIEGQPRLIARIHEGNTSTAYNIGVMKAIERQGGEWKRAPEWVSYCRATMEEK